jgi:hypothetical protein
MRGPILCFIVTNSDFIFFPRVGPQLTCSASLGKAANYFSWWVLSENPTALRSVRKVDPVDPGHSVKEWPTLVYPSGRPPLNVGYAWKRDPVCFKQT